MNLQMGGAGRAPCMQPPDQPGLVYLGSHNSTVFTWDLVDGILGLLTVVAALGGHPQVTFLPTTAKVPPCSPLPRLEQTLVFPPQPGIPVLGLHLLSQGGWASS